MTNTNHTLELNPFHALAVADAQKYGTNAALVLYHLRFWLDKNRQAGRNIKDGFVWSYQTSEYIQEQLPYLSQSTIKRILTKLVKLGVLIRSRFNKWSWDRTYWYTTPEFAVECPLKPAPIPIVQIEPCIVKVNPAIPDTSSTDKKTKPTTTQNSQSSGESGGSELVFENVIPKADRPKLAKIVAPVKDLPTMQQMIDVLTAAVLTNSIRKSPTAYLTALVTRHRAGTFDSTPGDTVAQNRTLRLENERRMKKADEEARAKLSRLTTQPKQSGSTQGHKDFIAACKVILA